MFVLSFKDLDFCSGSSLFCYKLRDLLDNGKNLCEKMGFVVNDQDCYNGVPASLKKGPAVVVKTQENYRSFMIPAAVTIGVVFWIAAYFFYPKTKGKENVRLARLKKFDKEFDNKS